MSKKSLIYIIFIIVTFGVDSQGQVINPVEISHLPNWNSLDCDSSRVSIYFPAFSANVSSIGPTFSDLVVKSIGNDYLLDGRSALIASKPMNSFNGNANLGTMGIKYRIQKLSIGLGYALRLISNTLYPQELLKIYTEGNAQYIGTPVNIGFSVNGSTFHQYSLGLGYNDRKFAIQGNFKILSGVQDIYTSNDQIIFETQDEYYQLHFQNDFKVNSTDLLTYRNIDDLSLTFDNNYGNSLFSKNRGVAFDINMSYAINDKLQLAVGAMDIGSIKWKEGANNYTSETEYEFSGVDIGEYLGSNESVIYLDSLNSLLRLHETNLSYDHKLPSTYYISGSYDLNSNMEISLTGVYTDYHGSSRKSLGVAYRYEVSKDFSVIGSGLYLSDAATYFGVHGVLDLGHFQLYGGTENLIGLFNIQNSSLTDFSFGSNLKF